MKYNLYLNMLILVTLVSVIRNSKVTSSNLQELFMKYHCFKLKSCDLKKGPKVCGFDDQVTKLAVFENQCTLHKANCKGFGMFHTIDMTVCDTQKVYEADHKNETFEFIKIIKTTSSTKF